MIFAPLSNLELKNIFDNDIFQPLIPFIKYLINNKKDFIYNTSGFHTKVYLNQIGSIECFGIEVAEFRGTKNSDHFFINYKNLVNIIGQRYNEL